MNNRRTLSKISITVGIATLFATGAILEVRRVRAMPSGGFEDQARFGMIGLTRGQTMRLNIVNLVNPPDPDRQAPPDPCRATMEVFDNVTGRTSLFSASFANPPEGERNQ